MTELRAESVLTALLGATPARTAEAPRDARGLYGLVNHRGDLRYIGSTSSPAETLYKRIHQRHRTGSESTSHYFSRMYNTGRMWRDPDGQGSSGDGKIAKALRNAIVADHRRTVWVALPDTLPIARLEREVLALAPPEVVAWNGHGTEAYDEPVELIDASIRGVGFGSWEIDVIERQRQRFRSRGALIVSAPRSSTHPSAPSVAVVRTHALASEVRLSPLLRHQSLQRRPEPLKSSPLQAARTAALAEWRALCAD